MVGADTVQRPGGDAAVVRVHGTQQGRWRSPPTARRAIASPIPVEGGKQAIAEAWRNLTAVGATPLAVTNCLNFANPQRPEIMGQIVGCLEGMARGLHARSTSRSCSGNVIALQREQGDRRRHRRSCRRRRSAASACSPTGRRSATIALQGHAATSSSLVGDARRPSRPVALAARSPRPRGRPAAAGRSRRRAPHRRLRPRADRRRARHRGARRVRRRHRGRARRDGAGRRDRRDDRRAAAVRRRRARFFGEDQGAVRRHRRTTTRCSTSSPPRTPPASRPSRSAAPIGNRLIFELPDRDDVITLGHAAHRARGLLPEADGRRRGAGLRHRGGGDCKRCRGRLPLPATVPRAPPRRRPGPSWEGRGNGALRSATTVPQLGPGLRRGGRLGEGTTVDHTMFAREGGDPVWAPAFAGEQRSERCRPIELACRARRPPALRHPSESWRSRRIGPQRSPTGIPQLPLA